MLLKDIRDYQILFLGSFLALGIGTRDWTLRPEMIGVAIACCLSTQLIFSFLNGQEQKLNLRSALITSLGLSLLLRADHWATMALAAVSAIASKFLFKVGDKHFFNPANFGIISALVFTSDAWVSPGQWGEEWWYGLLFAGTGGMILQRIGRWDTTAAFLGSYSLLEAIRNLWLGWTWDVYWHRLMSGSLLLFALFMVTDPRSIPNAKIGRVIWAICIASLTFILRNYFFLSTAVFWSLFALAPLTILIDFLWSSPRFSWLEGRGREAGSREQGGEKQMTVDSAL
ncbi:RnfABCDGE type electron transport complex subunit D [Nostoc sp. FACHB-152]|uniref:RnfABCDGE type electron transport complex subunit D n=1 Tax=unclassified Nostoc TaxID=2593658 RepID=UPI0016868083|nr:MULTISPECIES: RnfABCDGE type electron transport complex subunit D [unclassified Nostoc]MBD2449803.1 RnfABCDGE type electron transport complex subunit D [Nostoc sp. FACHB-152]MBD2473056.1 RnfABCDGE type electron transport complex subunit D [Nostoc sp. FACHB-145]